MLKNASWAFLSLFALTGTPFSSGCGSDSLQGENGSGAGSDRADMSPNGEQPPPPDPVTCRGAPYPIILAHGMAGFERIGPLNYFYNVVPDLEKRGERVYASQVSPYDSSMVRAGQLARFIEQVLKQEGACKVNIVAHSQGGIDSRYVISTLGYGDRIAALATVGTPHAGTPVADVALGLVPGFSNAAINLILLAVQGLTSNEQGRPDIKANLGQLATETMRQFNVQNPNDRRVKYYSVAGRSNLSQATSECKDSEWPNPSGLDFLNPALVAVSPVWTATSPNPLQPTPNDGLVPVASARWGLFLGCVPADHFDEVGQIAESGPDLASGFYHIDMYRKLIAQLHFDGL